MRWSVGQLLNPITVAAVLVLGILLAGLRLCATPDPGPPSFRSIREFQNFAIENGLYDHSGTRNAPILNNLYVADRPLTFEDTLLNKCAGYRAPGWRGVVWVCQIDFAGSRLEPDSIPGGGRIWGNVLAVGDEALLDRLEELFRYGKGTPR